MTTITATPNPGPSPIDPTFRYGTDDWTGSNALEYQVWQTPPVAAILGPDGVTVITPAVAGVPYDLTGCAVSGTIRYRPVSVATYPIRTAAPMPPLSGVVGSIVGDPKQGVVALSVLRSIVGTVSPQDPSAWGYPSQSLLIARPMVTGAGSGAPLVTVGDQPLFVF